MNESPPTNQRRRVLIAAAAVGATAGGAWLGLRHGAPTGLNDEVPGLWTQSFETPAGASLSMADLRGKPLLINFWATWCTPCVKELPDIDRFFRDHAVKGWQVLGLAIDSPTPVRDFLRLRPVGFPIGLAGLQGTELLRDLGNAQGGLPFTIAFDAAGRVFERKLGATTYDELARWGKKLA